MRSSCLSNITFGLPVVILANRNLPRVDSAECREARVPFLYKCLWFKPGMFTNAG